MSPATFLMFSFLPPADRAIVLVLCRLLAARHQTPGRGQVQAT
jgi:hypothetical protein